MNDYMTKYETMKALRLRCGAAAECERGENICDAARRLYGEGAMVDVMDRVHSDEYVGVIASHATGPFFGVYLKASPH